MTAPLTSHNAPSASLTQAVKDEALRLGFAAVGIADASALHNRRSELNQWLSAGFAGTLDYMAEFIERQGILLSRLPDVRSVVALAIPYPSEPAPQPAPEKTGRVARYAGGKDYHKVVKKKLKTLGEAIGQKTNGAFRSIAIVDTSAVQERVLAEAAGVGFIGKNTLLILPKGGSFVLLAALLTDTRLEPDKPVRWDCGDCTICLEACPTQALSPERPYQLDARACISNLTIENREAIPPPLREKIGGWVFGCDICQEVCPYNKKASLSPWPEFKAENGAGAALPLAETLAIRTDEAFLARFAGTPLMRPKREGLLRNAAVAAGNSGDPSLVPALEAALADPSSLVREHVSWALQRLQKA